MPTVLEPLQILPGVQPSTDRPESSTPHYTFSKAIRFVDGFAQKIGGWQAINFDDDTLNGVARSVFSYRLNNFDRYIYGTHTNLYYSLGTTLTNITPVKTTSVSIANAIDNFYATLGTDPISTVSGSRTVTITDTAHKFKQGDTVTLSGSTAVNGVPAGEINSASVIRATTANTYDIVVNTAATSTGSGGGSSVVRASGIITITDNAHALTEGDRVSIENAAAVGGITALQINIEHIIRNVTTNTFDVVTAGTSTSSVTGGGGASAEYFQPIDAGKKDTQAGTGYGAGLYGTGLYGVSKISTSTQSPRIWSHDRFGDLVIMCPGSQADIYSWDSSTSVAPVKVTNSPPANYVFTSNNICVALGYDTAASTAKDSAISWSDQGGLTNWSSGIAGSDVIEGAGRFLSQAQARGENLLFTNQQTYIFRFIGGQFVWQTQLLDPAIGIIAQNARAVARGIIYWMGNDNFYMWRGGNVEVIPSNSTSECTALRYVFQDLNYAQKDKIFAWYNAEFREIWWHYPTSSSNEPDRVIRLEVDDLVWSIDEVERTAGEYPAVIEDNPRLVNESGEVYLHEEGFNDGNNQLSWQLKSPFIYGGTNVVRIAAFAPDTIMTGNANVEVTARLYPNDVDTQNDTFQIDGNTGLVTIEFNGRFWQYNVTGDDLNQSFEVGQWYQELEKESPK